MTQAELLREKERRRRERERQVVQPAQVQAAAPAAGPQGPTFGSEAGRVAEQFNVDLANTLGLPVDAINAAFRALGVPVADVPFGGGESAQRGLQAIESISQPGGLQPETVLGRFAGAGAKELGASALPFGGAVRFAPQIAKAASPLISQVGQRILQKPLAATGAEVVASTGAGIGGEAARTLVPGSQAAELLGTVAGAAGPDILTAPLRAATRGVGQGPQVTRTAAEFAEAGIQPTAADVAQSGAARGLRSTLQKVPGSSGRVNREIARVSDEFAQTVNTLIGTDPVSAERAGRVIRKGLVGETGFVTRFQGQASKLYDDLSDKIDDAGQVGVNRSFQALDELANPVAGAPGISDVLANDKITALRNALASDATQDAEGNLSLSFGALKALRTRIGQMLSTSEIVADAPRAELKRIYAAVTEDMGDAAINAGAQKEFTRANRFWKSGIKRIDDQLQNIAQKVNDEDVFLQATRGKEGATRIRAARRSLKPEEWDVVSKTVLKRFGKLPPGQQDAFGEGFSVDRWLTDINKLSPEARDAIFGGTNMAGPIKNLQKVAGEVKAAGRVGFNPSGTAQGLTQVALLGSGAALLTGNVTPALLAGTTALTANRAAVLMSNPAFVRWLAGSAQIAPERLPGYIGRLSNLGQNNPELEGPLAEYAQILSGVSGGNVRGIDINRPILENPDGSFSTEESITITDGRLNQGRPTNIPTIVGGRRVSDDEAVNAAIQSGQRFNSFDTIEAAVSAAQARSQRIGQIREKDRRR